MATLADEGQDTANSMYTKFMEARTYGFEICKQRDRQANKQTH